MVLGYKLHPPMKNAENKRQEALSPTIAELWEEFGKLKYYIDLKNKEVGWYYRKEEADALRQQLLDKCESEYGLKVVGAMVWHDSKKAGWNNPKNYGSAWLFMDWELEQREKEA